MKNLFSFFNKTNIGNPPYDYYFLLNLPKKEYPKYLEKIFYFNTGEKLTLSRELRIENGKLRINYLLRKEK